LQGYTHTLILQTFGKRTSFIASTPDGGSITLSGPAATK
jgi:hypothetical protein